MNKRHEVFGLGVTLALALSACAGVSDGDDFDDDGTIGFRSSDAGGTLSGGDDTDAKKGVPSGGGWLGNGLEEPTVSGFDPAYALSTEEGLSSDGLVVGSAYRDTARYVVECALADGDSVTKVVDAEVVTFYGRHDLAPEWRDGSCDQDCQEWVSACVLARTNHTGENVQIWMQADHPAIGFGIPGEAVLEAGFYGNLFAATDEKFYCKGDGGSVVDAKLEGRTCSDPSNPCEFDKYSSCSTRCDLVGPGADVPANCVAGDAGSSTDTYRTIATYIVE